MKRRDVLPGHAERPDRRDLGKTGKTGSHAFATTPACQCGWRGTEVLLPPSRGGSARAQRQHQAHVADLISRSPEFTLDRARSEWRDWCPGNGAAYRVRVLPICGGMADTDRILLVNVGARTWAFQYPINPTRQERFKLHADYIVPLFKGVPPSVQTATEPLLKALGALDGE
jgi:hypothetical protein